MPSHSRPALRIALPLLLSRWPRTALRLLLPSTCALCGGGCDGAVCAACEAAYARPRAERCGRCGNPLAGSMSTSAEVLSFPEPPQKPSFPRRREQCCGTVHSKFASVIDGSNLDPRLRGDDVEPGRDEALVCGVCLTSPPAFDATIAAVDYAIPLDQLVLQLKFGARLALAPWFARMLVEAVLARPDLPLPDLLCPVPLGPARLVERGFNQALEIARPLAAALGVPCHARLAARTLETPAQSGVSPRERARNVRAAFAVNDPGLVEGRHVGLVDDVMTSGHTLDELAATCKRFGAARVTNLVFARTPPHT